MPTAAPNSIRTPHEVRCAHCGKEQPDIIVGPEGSVYSRCKRSLKVAQRGFRKCDGWSRHTRTPNGRILSTAATAADVEKAKQPQARARRVMKLPGMRIGPAPSAPDTEEQGEAA